MYIKGGTM